MEIINTSPAVMSHWCKPESSESFTSRAFPKCLTSVDSYAKSPAALLKIKDNSASNNKGKPSQKLHIMNWISSIGSDKRLSDLFFRVQQKFSFTWTSECLSLQQKHQSHQTHEQQSSILVHCKVACHNKKHWIIRICSPSRETKPSVKQQRLPSSLLSHQLPQIQCQTQSHSGDSRKWSITGKSSRLH